MMLRSFTLSLTQRDMLIVAFVYSYDGVVLDQILRRFWPSPGARSAGYARVARLIEAGYLRSCRLPATEDRGSGKTWLTLGPRALPLLTERLNLVPSDLRHVRKSFVPLFHQHEVAIRDVRLDLELACTASSQVSLASWTLESDYKRHPLMVHDPQLEEQLKKQCKTSGLPKSAEVPLIPDGAFTLRMAGARTKHFLFELDRGTLVSPRRFRAKVRGHLLYTKQQPTPILFVVPSLQRAAQISHWVKQEAEALGVDPRVVWIAERGQISEHTILTGNIWQVVGGPAVSLVPSHNFDSAMSPAAPPQPHSSSLF